MQFDARPTVASTAGDHHQSLAGTKLHCSVTEARVCVCVCVCVCEQLAQDRYYLKARPPGVEPIDRKSSALTTMSPGHTQVQP